MCLAFISENKNEGLKNKKEEQSYEFAIYTIPQEGKFFLT
jgi:hypothetical protein